jgi:copper(I)-binding protein
VNRALRAATMGVLLLSPVALSACSAGQVTQTNTQDRDKSGPMAEAGDITMRAIQLTYPSSGRYQVGDSAELTAAVINTSQQPDTLLSITGDDFEGVRAIGGGAQPVSDARGFSTRLNIQIPPTQTVFLGGDGPTILLENLTQSLTPAQSIPLTMTFEKAGQVTVQALVDNPSQEVARGQAYNFNQEDAQRQGDNREVASGAGQGG